MSAADERVIFDFGGGLADGGADMKSLLGGKGANLAEMTRLGIPVPPGFTIASSVANSWNDGTGQLRPALIEEIENALRRLEEKSTRRFGDPADPLLVSVRSGAAVSMPGMMDTILNLGLNDETVVGLIERTGDARFAWDTYRRFLQMYGEVVMGVSHGVFERALDDVKLSRGIWRDTDLDASALEEATGVFKEHIEIEAGAAFPQDPSVQLHRAVVAVFESWNNDRAIVYRRTHTIDDALGTAVSVQTMVFGNMGEDCATGVAFTRDPATGERRFFGEYLQNAQGEDVVAGYRTPASITAADGPAEESLEVQMPEAYADLFETAQQLEAHYGDMQDIEFTIESGKVWLLQTRGGKRTAQAAIRIAVDMVEEGIIDTDAALMRVDAESIEQLLHPRLDPDAARAVIARGLPASPGAVSGAIVFTADEAERQAQLGKPVILVRVETSPEDIRGMVAAEGVLTARGGLTSHAAVVARGMGKCCVTGCSALRVRAADGIASVSGRELRAGDIITLDGSTGEVMLGEVPLVDAATSAEYDRLMAWADDARTLKVRANADNASDATRARRLGAEGIGLCRTEHMFFEGERIAAMRRLILAKDEDQRREALAVLEPMQEGDFAELFAAMDGLPVTIRLLDPPLHEFLPHGDADVSELAALTGHPEAAIHARVEAMSEANPMLGHRGCRLGLSHPAIYEMQTRAIIHAAIDVATRGVVVEPEIMIPLVGDPSELSRLRARVAAVADACIAAAKADLTYTIGTMIELPRACLVADQIAEEADFFSFGTNDLTQTTFGISRDDASRFLPGYVADGLLPADPFVAIDRAGVGRLMKLAVDEGRAAHKSLKIGICGEHGGEPSSVEYCHALGLDYVSCSPFRVPIARLAAAQAAVLHRQEST